MHDTHNLTAEQRTALVSLARLSFQHTYRPDDTVTILPRSVPAHRVDGSVGIIRKLDELGLARYEGRRGNGRGRPTGGPHARISAEGMHLLGLAMPPREPVSREAAAQFAATLTGAR